VNALRMRIAVLWACIGLFLLRVLGQIEVVLIAPVWLPPMEAWYSGLLPYPLLLPAQILILMLMTGLTVNEMRRPHGGPGRHWLRVVSLLYFSAMLVRLIVQFLRGADNVIAAGGIPVAFHWVLALFLLVLSRTATRHQLARAVDRADGVVERIQ
jgi:hypothetical protein